MGAKAMLEVEARAKINWTLDVTGKRADGYHTLDMLMQSVSLCDKLTLSKAEGFSLTLSRGARVPDDGKNLVLRAAHALEDFTGKPCGAAMTLEKHIPVAAGMGGGSADAAGVLVGLNQLWDLGLSHAQLEEIGLTIGADVPFCIRGGLARAQGVGEVLTPLNAGREIWLLAIQPCRGLSTKDVFGALQWDAIDDANRPQTDKAIAALAKGNIPALAGSIGNVLQPIAKALRPPIGEAIDALRGQGALVAQMTGSGSAVIGAFANARMCRAALNHLRTVYRGCRMMSTQAQGIVVREK